MNGLVVKEAFFLILSAIFAVTVLVVLAVADTASNSPPEGFDKIWSTFNQFKGAAASGFVAIGAFLWLFSTFLWRFKWFYPWLVMHRDISGTWFAESIPGVWNTFTTLMHVDHGFFRISVVLLRPESRGRSVIAAFERSETHDPRLFVVYNSFVRPGPGMKTPSDGRSADHSGCLRLDLIGEKGPEADWTLEGEYWTNKQYDDDAIDQTGREIHRKGTWGRMQATFKGRSLLPMTDPMVTAFLNKHRTVATPAQAPI